MTECNKAPARKPLSIDAARHFGTREYSVDYETIRKTQQLHARTSWHYKFSRLNQPGGMFNLSGGQFNPHFKVWMLLFLAVAMGIGGIVLANGPAFHSYQTGPTGPVNRDPKNVLWEDTGATGNLNDFNSILATYQTSGNCAVAATNGCIRLVPNSTQTAIALTKSAVGDLGLGSGKTLALANDWLGMSGAFNQFDRWGYYLTSNSTLPTEKNYNPDTDPNVVLSVSVICDTNPTCPHDNALHQYDTELKALRVSGQKATISSEDTGGCPGGISGTKASSSSCYLSDIRSIAAFPDVGGSLAYAVVYLNTTAQTIGGTSCQIISGVVYGSGCSWVFGSSVAGFNGAATQALPFVKFETQQYFLGFFASFNDASGVQWTFNVDTSVLSGNGEMENFIYVPNPTAAALPPQIDTGGFFGPIIQALINLGIWIWRNILLFAVFLWNVIQPLVNTVLTLAVTILSAIVTTIFTVVKAVLNAIGTSLGLGSLGDNLYTLLSNVTAWFTTLFSNSLAQLGSSITFLVNAYSAFSTIIGTYWTDATGWFSALKDWLGGFWAVAGLIWGSVITIDFLLSIWMLYGVTRFLNSLQEGLEWYMVTALGIKTLFGLAWFLFVSTINYLVIPIAHFVTAAGTQETAAQEPEVAGFKA